MIAAILAIAIHLLCYHFWLPCIQDGWPTRSPRAGRTGEIEAIGRKVTHFKRGDPIFASTFDVNFGGHAEYKCLPENGVIAIKPVNLTYSRVWQGRSDECTRYELPVETGDIRPVLSLFRLKSRLDEFLRLLSPFVPIKADARRTLNNGN